MKNKNEFFFKDKISIFKKKQNSKIERRNSQFIAVLEYEDEIKSGFEKIDIMTLNVIAKLASDVKQKYDNLNNTNVPEINISELVLSFCKDTWRIDTEFELNFLYDEDYFAKKINQCCLKLVHYIHSSICKSLIDKNKANLLYKKLLEICINAVGPYATIKFNNAVSDNNAKLNAASILERASATILLDYECRDIFIYLLDLLSMGICVSKIMFVNRQVLKIKEEDDFYNIILNMTKEINDTNLIIEKVRPIYDEFYSEKYGEIKGNLLFSIFIIVLKNKINQKEFLEKYDKIVNINNSEIYNDFIELDGYIRRWLYNLADTHRDLDINICIIIKIVASIYMDNFDLFFKTLSMSKEYENLYNKNVRYNNKVSDKERYLKGDFKKEKEQLNAKYLLNNISTGAQFELYLVNLFKDLGYQVKHSGKAGDQGADLILKKNNYIYAVQAKYYTGKLSNTPIQEVVGSLKYYNANQGVVITNSYFSDGACKLAKANNVILIDGKDLKKLIDYTFKNEFSGDVLRDF